MVGIELTAAEIKVLIEANNLYLFDWRENDDDEATAGWRHPGYFLEVGQPNDFTKLVDAGLMEKGGNPDYVTYRITELGMAEVANLEAQNAPRGGAASAAPITRTEVAYALINTLYQDMKQNPDDGKKALAYFRELADARLSDVYDLMDERSELRAQLAAAQDRERVLSEKVSAYENVWLYTGWKAIADILDKAPIRDWESVYARALGFVIGKARQMAELQAAQAQQPGRADGYAVGQEVILLDGTSLIGQVIEKGYKVSLDGSEGRWYSADELAAYVARKTQDAARE